MEKWTSVERENVLTLVNDFTTCNYTEKDANMEMREKWQCVPDVKV